MRSQVCSLMNKPQMRLLAQWNGLKRCRGLTNTSDRRSRSFLVKHSRSNSTSSLTTNSRKVEFRLRSDHKSISGVAGALKRGLDLAGAFAAIATLWPVLGVIALIVKYTDRGPIF